MSAATAREKDDAFRLLACDLDGTLLSERGKLSKRARSSLGAAHARGLYVVISTGRTRAQLPKALLRMPEVAAFITSNGASVFLKAGDPICRKTMDAETAAAILEQLPEERMAVNAFLGGKAWFETKSLRMLRPKKPQGSFSLGDAAAALSFLPHLRSHRQILNKIWRAGASGAGVEKIGAFFTEKEEAQELLSALLRRGDVTAVTTVGSDIEITAKGVSKGAALQAISAYYHVPAAKVLACGDSGNDLDMKSYCGLFVAPDTASAEVLALADVVTDSAKADGVAKWLLDRFGGEQ